MNHEQTIVLALREIAGDLDTHERDQLDVHLAECETCRAEVQRLRAADAALHAWGAQQAPPSPPAESRAIPPLLNRPWWTGVAAAALVGIALGTFGGYMVGSRQDQRSTRIVGNDTRPAFALLLEEPASQWPPRSPMMRQGYAAWRDSLVAEGLFLGGERLSIDAGVYVGLGDSTASGRGSTTPTGPNFSGFMLIRARDYDEAARIAQASPHVRYGGVLVRRIF